MRVLLVDDEVRLAEGVRRGLEAEGFAVDVAHNGVDGLWRAREFAYDVIVLDVMMPGMSGYRVCSTLRAEQDWTPVLFLTAKDGEWDEVEGLDTGGDDWLTKPFSPPVLVARLRALVRRGGRERPTVLECLADGSESACVRIGKRGRDGRKACRRARAPIRCEYLPRSRPRCGGACWGRPVARSRHWK